MTVNLRQLTLLRRQIYGIMSSDIIHCRMASPGGAMSEGHGIMSSDIILKIVTSGNGGKSVEADYL